VKPGVKRRLADSELPPAGAGEWVIGFVYDSDEARDHYVGMNQARGYGTSLFATLDGEPASIIRIQIPAG
jgi:hypothetical protein